MNGDQYYEDQQGGAPNYPPIQPGFMGVAPHSQNTNIIVMTSTDDELHQLELKYKGLREDSQGELIRVGEPLMNDEGVNSVLGQVQALLNRHTIMSNLNDKEISALMDFLGDTLSKDLMLNRKQYIIRDNSARDKIYFTALSESFAVLKRGYQEGDKRFWKGTQQDVTFRNEGTESKRSLFTRAVDLMKGK